MALVFKLIVLALILGSSSQVMANDTRHSLNLGWSVSEDQVGGSTNNGDERQRDIEPEGLDLSYSYRLNEQLSVSVQYAEQSAQLPLQQSFQLNRDLDSYLASFSYMLPEDYSLSATYRYQHQSTRVGSSNNLRRYKEEYRLQDLGLNVARDIFLDEWLFTPSLSVSYQIGRVNLVQNFLYQSDFFGRPLAISDNDRQRSEGLYMGAGLDLARLFSISDQLDLILSSSVSWAKPVSGNVTTHSTISISNQPIRPNQTDEALNETSGSGAIGFSSIFLYQSYSLSVGYQRSFSSEPNLGAWSISLGIDF